MPPTVKKMALTTWRNTGLCSVPSAGLHGRVLRADNEKFFVGHSSDILDPKARSKHAIARATELVDKRLAELKRHLVGTEQMKKFLENEQVDVELFEEEVEDLLTRRRFPDFIVFTTVAEKENPEKFFDDIRPIVDRMNGSDEQSYMVIVFAEPSPLTLLLTAKLFAEYPRLKGRLEIAHRIENLENELSEAFAKAVGDWRYTTPTLLEDAREYLKGVVDLYSDRKPSRLCAAKISKVFGFTLTAMARILSNHCKTPITLAALSATPDADRLQDGLRHFEYIARLRTVMNEDEFSAWLGTANWSLDGDSPRQCIIAGDVDVVAGLAARIIVGNPS